MVEDKLFATLDACVRTLDPSSHPPVVAIDTVGFISHLPPALVASFRSTLEEVGEADLVVNIVDGSSPRARAQIEVTEKILKELGAHETPRITVLGKADLVSDRFKMNRAKIAAPGAMIVSAFNKDDVLRLRDAILGHFRKNLELWEVVVPFADGRTDALLHAHSDIERRRQLEKGMFYRVRIDPQWARRLGLARYRL
ncbi:MAG: hypothetical protein A2583_14840 [Bdellovibrionales bacterium RIFOXYD1_FULL_53_11]|nr:MAG: hypothetical protein A2583_14840 [Bdellovibrionales bacterium RIFOXYD1_FULL_53_11]